VLSITLGLRPGELRRLTWDHVDLDNGVVHVWRSASRSGDVKTPKSKHWYAHEGRHTAVSIMSSNCVPLQEISDTVGHKSTHVTETVYRHVIVPAIRGGASVMDSVFGGSDHNLDNGSEHDGNAEIA